MKNPDNIQLVAALLPDMMGFIFYPASPRYAGGLRPEVVAALPECIGRTGVFVNEEIEKIEEIVAGYSISVIQLHGNEPPEICGKLQEKGYRVIKAFGIASEADLQQTAAYEGKCDYFLFDTRSQYYGGTGKTFDWNYLKSYRGATPFLLSGGIATENMEAVRAIRHPQFAGVDLNSRFEAVPGEKDLNLLAAFIHALRAV